MTDPDLIQMLKRPTERDPREVISLGLKTFTAYITGVVEPAVVKGWEELETARKIGNDGTDVTTIPAYIAWRDLSAFYDLLVRCLPDEERDAFEAGYEARSQKIRDAWRKQNGYLTDYQMEVVRDTFGDAALVEGVEMVLHRDQEAAIKKAWREKNAILA